MDKTSIILLCQGGAGDVLAHTPMIRYFRKKYPEDEIIVLATYSQLLEHNPNIDKLIPLKDPGDFYSEYVHKKNVRFFKKHFVYDSIMDEPAKSTTSLPEFICRVYGAEYDGGPLDYFVTDKEIRIANTFINQYRRVKNLPVVLLQCTGAIPSDGPMNKTNNLKDLNIETVNKLVEKNAGLAWFIQIGLEGELVVGKYVKDRSGETVWAPSVIDGLGMPMREAIAMIHVCDTFIFIESLFAHCSSALNKRGVVVFQNMSPDFFGYKHNLNICHEPEDKKEACSEWPCNRPVGALLDMLPGYKNPKTRQLLLWECSDQVCAKITVDELNTGLHTVLDELKDKNGSTNLDEVRSMAPKKIKAKKPIESPSMGKIIAGDVNLTPHGDESDEPDSTGKDDEQS